MWKTVVDFKKNRNTKNKMVSMAVMTDSPTNAVATFFAENGEKRESKREKNEKIVGWRRRAQA